jgi:hypothetical protein
MLELSARELGLLECCYNAPGDWSAGPAGWCWLCEWGEVSNNALSSLHPPLAQKIERPDSHRGPWAGLLPRKIPASLKRASRGVLRMVIQRERRSLFGNPGLPVLTPLLLL